MYSKNDPLTRRLSVTVACPCASNDTEYQTFSFGSPNAFSTDNFGFQYTSQFISSLACSRNISTPLIIARLNDHLIVWAYIATILTRWKKKLYKWQMSGFDAGSPHSNGTRERSTDWIRRASRLQTINVWIYTFRPNSVPRRPSGREKTTAKLIISPLKQDVGQPNTPGSLMLCSLLYAHRHAHPVNQISNSNSIGPYEIAFRKKNNIGKSNNHNYHDSKEILQKCFHCVMPSDCLLEANQLTENHTRTHV